ncbi:CPBP family intramembrane metalloprotease [bacterium c-19]|nr:CPBP family intramembrane metalloprotease [bacterium c-19]
MIFLLPFSAVLFGGLHLLNVLGGADLFLTLLQVLNTTAFGFICIAFYCKTNHILPCILCHGLYNAFDIFMPADRYDAMFLGEAIVIITAFIYGIYLMKMNNFNGESSLYSVID